MINYSRNDIDHWDKKYRAQFINSVTGFKSANLIGTISADGVENLAIVSSVTHFGSNPPLLGFVMRPISVTRDTYNNILATNHYTINHVNRDIYQKAHQTAARYPAEISEFDQVGLSSEYLLDFMAPFVQLSTIKIGMELVEIIPIKANNTILVLGEIVAIHLSEEFVSEDGALDIHAAGTITIAGLDAYFDTVLLEKLPYAKP